VLAQRPPQDVTDAWGAGKVRVVEPGDVDRAAVRAQNAAARA
jgi:hypothetical protein